MPKVWAPRSPPHPSLVGTVARCDGRSPSGAVMSEPSNYCSFGGLAATGFLLAAPVLSRGSACWANMAGCWVWLDRRLLGVLFAPVCPHAAVITPWWAHPRTGLFHFPNTFHCPAAMAAREGWAPCTELALGTRDGGLGRCGIGGERCVVCRSMGGWWTRDRVIGGR